MPAIQTPAANPAPVDNRKVEAAAKRAAKKAMRQFATDHNAKIEAAKLASAAHESKWGVDGYECA